MTDTARKPILVLTTAPPRTPVVIDGDTCEMRSAAELTIVDLMKLERQGPRLGELLKRAGAGEAITDEEVNEVRQLLDELSRIILAAPEPVLAALSDANRMALLQRFTDTMGSIEG